MEQHQGNQAQHLRLPRHQLAQQTTQADGFGAQAPAAGVGTGAGTVALVEEGVDDRQHTDSALPQALGGLCRQRRVAAGEAQPQPVVLDPARGSPLRFLGEIGGCPQPQLLKLGRPDRLTAQAVERPVAGGGHQPGTGVTGHPVAFPALQGSRESVLGALFRQAAVAGDAGQACDRGDGRSQTRAAL